MATWYKVERYKDAPVAVKVTRATEHRVWVMEQPWTRLPIVTQPKEVQRHRNSGGDVYYPTWAEAREHIVNRASDDYGYKVEAMDQAARVLEKAVALPMEPQP